MGASVQIEGLSRLEAVLARLGGGDHTPLLEALAGEGESQTRRRIESERTTPAGASWPAWSPVYAAHRPDGGHLLQSSGALVDSIAAFVDDGVAGWGTNLVYAATHQYGDPRRNIPARTYMGLSSENLDDLLVLMNDYMDSLLS